MGRFFGSGVTNPGPGQVPADRRGRDRYLVMVVQVPGDGVRPGVQALPGQLLAQRDEVGGHPGMAGAFVILQFDDAMASDVVYIETQAGDLFLESETDVSRFSAIFEHLRALALPPEASATLITRIAHKMEA